MSTNQLPQFFHHIELQSQSARLLASTLSRVLSLPIIGTLRTKQGISYYLQSQQAVIICTAQAPLFSDDTISINQSSNFHEDLKKIDGIQVRAIGLKVPDIKVTQEFLENTIDTNQAETIHIQNEKIIDIQSLQALGQIKLRFLEADCEPVSYIPSGAPRLMEMFNEIMSLSLDRPSVPGGIIGIDHIAVDVSNVPESCQRLKELTGWEFFRVFEEDALQRPLSAITIGSPTSEGLLTIVQPTRKSSVFAHTLEANGGTCVHHIALRCENIFQFADHLSSQMAWERMPPPDKNYYQKIKETALEFLDGHELQKLEKYGMLLDFDHDCAIIQVFLPYLSDVPGVFFELISRIPKKGSGDAKYTKPGCGGFGDHNVTELYDCMVRDIKR